MASTQTRNKFLEDALKQINQARAAGNSTLTPTRSQQEPTNAGLIRAITIANAAIERTAGIDTAYHQEAKAINQQYSSTDWLSLNYTISAGRLLALLGVLAAMTYDFENGNVKPFEELARAEVFTDFLDMAEHLLTQGYKDPAAVLIGGVLEDHIKKLSLKFNISVTVPKINGKGEREVTVSDLNIELRKAGAYSLAEQKSIDAQLAIRNYAAHAEWNEYTAEKVRLMHTTVRQFIATHS